MALNISAFSILSEEEQEVINKMNDTVTNYRTGITLPDLLKEQAELHPWQVAVMSSGRTYTYHELDCFSNQIAAILNREGAGRGQVVGIIGHRGYANIAGIWGILKAGSGYLPIDPHYPGKRIQYMLKDSACGVIVAESSTLKEYFQYFPENVHTVICLDETDESYEKINVYDRKDIERQEKDNWMCDAGEDDLAYVIYTSGSTGEPKGVMVTHRAILNTLFWLQDYFGLSEEDIIAQKTSVSFTDSVWEIFWPLIVGARLSILEYDIVKDPHKLFMKLKKDRVTITQFVPAQMKLFLDTIQLENLDGKELSLKWIFNGGEALPVNNVREWYDKLPNVNIANIYGMTESAIYATYYIIEECPDETQMSIPLGKPISNTRVYILDEFQNLCPFQVKGEICIGGTGITIGYWHKKEITEMAFTRHPHTGERLYRTGDVGALRPDGVLEYFGRKDDQVQVRGYRVELKEVEQAILNHQYVKQAVVTAKTDKYGTVSLYCYYTASDERLDQNQLREHAEKILPEYMIPSVFIQLEKMELTPNGKIDKSKMPEVDVHLKKRKGFVPPGNDEELKLAVIWSEILELPVEEIGIHDNFLDIGGTSVSIVRLHKKMKEASYHNVTVAQLFSYPTIASYLNHIENRNVTDDKVDLEIMRLLESIEEEGYKNQEG